MKLGPAALSVFLLAGLGHAEDARLRAEAVQLLERATAASTAPKLPDLERIDTFRVFGPESEAREGSFSREVIQGTGHRDEWTFGEYHLLNIWMGKRVIVSGSSHIQPAEVETMMRLTPIYLVRFDHEDIIREIVNRDVNGRAARCVRFDTVAGERTRQNELCVDASNGTFVYGNLNDEIIENSDFFPFAGVLIPGKISYSGGGGSRMEITQTMTALTDPTPNVLAAPPNAEIHQVCTQYRRAFGLSMPQPKAGAGSQDADLLLRGMIGVDGRVHEAVVQESERPDLNAEALTLAQQWVFTPAMCNGQPNRNEVSFTLHFKGR
jgi:TonB family protein